MSLCTVRGDHDTRVSSGKRLPADGPTTSASEAGIATRGLVRESRSNHNAGDDGYNIKPQQHGKRIDLTIAPVEFQNPDTRVVEPLEARSIENATAVHPNPKATPAK